VFLDGRTETGCEARRDMPGSSGFESTKIALPIAGLHPAHVGLRVAHLSDLHIGFGTPHARLAAAVRFLNHVRPDIVAITGDMLTRHWPVPLAELNFLEDLTSPVYISFGNHEIAIGASAIRKTAASFGATVLRNEHRVETFRAHPLTIVGLDDEGRSNRVFASAESQTPGTTVIVLCHWPTIIDQLPENRGWVCLSGHVHGGAIVVPILTPLLFRLLGQPYLAGPCRIRGNHLYVNRGLGYGSWCMPRFRARPEVAIVELVDCTCTAGSA